MAPWEKPADMETGLCHSYHPILADKSCAKRGLA